MTKVSWIFTHFTATLVVPSSDYKVVLEAKSSFKSTLNTKLPLWRIYRDSVLVHETSAERLRTTNVSCTSSLNYEEYPGTGTYTYQLGGERSIWRFK